MDESIQQYLTIFRESLVGGGGVGMYVFQRRNFRVCMYLAGLTPPPPRPKRPNRLQGIRGYTLGVYPRGIPLGYTLRVYPWGIPCRISYVNPWGIPFGYTL